MGELEDFSRDEIERIAGTPEVRRAVLEAEEGTPYGYPEPPSRDSLLKLFRDVLGLSDDDWLEISKSGNVKDNELGFLSVPSRVYLDLAGFSESEGWVKVAGYLRSKSNIIFSTSLSRKAALLTLAVTQKSVKRLLSSPVREVKSGLFGKTERVVGGEEE